MSQLIVDGVSVEIEGRRLVDQVLLDVAPGQFVGLVGPNGSGKSSLLRAIYRVLKPSAGRIVHLGDEVWKVSARQAARRMAVVAQERMGEFDFTVDEIVMMGRTPHKRLLDTDTAADHELVERCLGRCATAPGGCSRASRVARSSVCWWHAPWRSSPSSWCWTSRPITSISATSSNCSS